LSSIVSPNQAHLDWLVCKNETLGALLLLVVKYIDHFFNTDSEIFSKIFKSFHIFSEIRAKLFPDFTMVEFFDLLPSFSFDIFKCILNVKFLPELLKG